MLSVRKLDAYRVYLTRVAWESFAFGLIFGVNMVYQIQSAQLDALQLVLVGTLLEVTCFLGEIPTGIVADVYSRRLSIIIGFFLIGLGFVVEGLFPFFAAILLAQVFWGLGATFTSGASDAWIVDEIGEERAGKAFIRAGQVGSIAGLFATVVGMVLVQFTGLLFLPVVIGGALHILLALFLIAFMPETGFVPTPRENRSTWQQMGHTFKGGLRMVRARPMLLTMLGIGFFYGLYSEGYDRLYNLHMIETIGLPDWGLNTVVWFGGLSIIGTVVYLSVSEIVRRRVNTSTSFKSARALWIITAGMVIGLLIFALTDNFVVAVFGSMLFSTLRRIVHPIFAAWQNQLIESEVRATVLSMFAQTDAIGQIAGGPAVGALGRVSLRAAMVACAAILSPALLMIGRIVRREQQVTVIAIVGD